MLLRAAVLAVHAGLLAALRPGDPNVCSYWESFTAPVKESYTKPHVVSSSEPCPGGLGLPLPCPQQRVVYRTEYRQAVRTDYRRRYQCCQGYYESRDSCIPHCSHECVHGRCVAPELCQCEPGWRGPSCSSGEDWGNWGELGTAGAGHPQPGVADGAVGVPRELGHPRGGHPGTGHRDGRGYVGMWHMGTRPPQPAAARARSLCRPGTPSFPNVACNELDGLSWGLGATPGATSALSPPCPPCRCQERCPEGRYGQDCQESCDCANGGQCFHVDGGCLCEAGFQGSRCEERHCLPGLYGLHCQSRCLCHPQHSQSCHPMLGECVCLPGWAGLYCNESCPTGYFGPGCLQSCLCLHGGVCNGTTGHCHCPPGYTDEHCSSLCPPNTFGTNCSGRCSCQHALACSPLDGSCFCKEGWHGPDCSTPCPAGTWGPSCNRSCDCAHGASCDPQSGTCHCPPGWQGPRCLQPCPNGTFGAGCGERCACAHADGCDPVTGECHCLPGWRGLQCEQGCAHGSWGRGCRMSCSCHNGASCSPQDGSCTCAPGYRGPSCQRPCAPGRYGKRCSLSCSCANGSSCHPNNGSCLCTPGWHGPRCSQQLPVATWVTPTQFWPGQYGAILAPVVLTTSWLNGPGVELAPVSPACPPGTFGLPCDQLCRCPHNATCDPTNGTCPCAPGTTGPRCEAGNPEQPYTIEPAPPAAYSPLGMVLSLVALVVLLVAVVAATLCYHHRQRGKERRHLAVAYRAGQTDTSDYMVPGQPGAVLEMWPQPRCPSCTTLTAVPADVPPSHHAHYYSNPSYHTLSQCPLAAPSPQDRASSLKVPGTQLFPSLERPYSPEGNATLPPDWKHLGASALGPRG
ncbi:PEAR1 protein, partial [Aleadryas rufinucha]|nr:PEAR1 protein [Aleadryas rufinucha]